MPELKEIRLYVSSEYKERKADGGLFKVVESIEGVDYKRWKHTGDSENSDFLQPNKLGIKAYLYERKCGWLIYNYLEKNYTEESNVHILSGVSKVLERTSASINYNVGIRLGAPIAVTYAEWIIQQCKLRNIKKLFFMARDGYILKIIVDKIVESSDYKISTRYIYASRDLYRTKDERQIDLLHKYFFDTLKINESDAISAFVDVFGTGKSLDTISESLNLEGMKCFFLFSDKLNKGNVEKIVMTQTVDVWDNIELFFKAPHSQCLRLIEQNGIVDVEYDEKETTLLLTFGIEDYIKSIKDFCEVYLSLRPYYLSSGLNIKLFETYINLINSYPDEQLIKFFVYFPRIDKQKKGLSLWFREKELKIKRIKFFVKMLEKKRLFNLIK